MGLETFFSEALFGRVLYVPYSFRQLFHPLHKLFKSEAMVVVYKMLLQ